MKWKEDLQARRVILLQQIAAIDVLLRDWCDGTVHPQAVAAVVGAPEAAPSTNGGRKARATPQRGPTTRAENRLERADRAREIVLGLPMPVKRQAITEALCEADLGGVSVGTLLHGMLEAGTLRKKGRAIYESTGKTPEKPVTVGEDLEARKAALGIAVKKKEED